MIETVRWCALCRGSGCLSDECKVRGCRDGCACPECCPNCDRGKLTVGKEGSPHQEQMVRDKWVVYFMRPAVPGQGRAMVTAFYTTACSQAEILAQLPKIDGRDQAQDWYPRKLEDAPEVPFHAAWLEAEDWVRKNAGLVKGRAE